MSDVTPTQDEVARAKRWASMQSPPVTVNVWDKVEMTYHVANYPDWMDWENPANHCHGDEADAWSALAIALRPVFASIAPVVAAEERERCAKRIENGSFLHDQAPTALFAKEAAAAIRAMK